MPHDLPKAYDPTAIEDHWAAYWVRENLFAVPTPTPGTTPGQNQRLDGQSDGQSFTILLPPPNVTGRLHMGHMLNQTEMDILIRWRRMSGRLALWVPGTDHAGIATQMMVERQLASEGTSRQKLGREAFIARVWEWRRHYGGVILEQMKRLGASVDWSREFFTMDERRSLAVREAFVRLYHQGLIYRGAYIVNWCPRCQTAISDLEVVHQEQKGHLWEIRYSVLGPFGKDSGEYITVATTRPETMLGDTAVAVHPEDERYKHLHGKKLRLPLMNREIPIILDEWVSREFGTGAVKVTPAHDPNDFALAERHHLPAINVMDDRAHINENGGPYKGLDRYVARKKIVADLEEQGLLAGIKDYTTNVGHCDRCKTVVEPRLSTQWFVAVNKKANDGRASMAELAIAAVKPDADGNKAIRFTPENYEKIYLDWMTNIHDWCISRQLWWGHRIPAWHCAACRKITVPEPNGKNPTACAHCGSKEIAQETDVLDTWFSSGLLPVSVFGWPNIPTPPGHPERVRPSRRTDESKDLHFSGASSINPGDSPSPVAPSFPERGEAGARERVGDHVGSLEINRADAALSRADFDAFYPTSLLVTGFDILFFWVARMIMLGCWFAAEVPMPDGRSRALADSVPFKEIYIHALVRDANREKMSKTKGNVIDPIEIVKKYGTDAVRFTLASMASPGTDIAFNVARTEGYRAFANKIWNAARFIFLNVDKAAEAGIPIDVSAWGGMPTATGDATDISNWIVAEFRFTTSVVNESLEINRFDDAANATYHFFWDIFCDRYLEYIKCYFDFSENINRTVIQEILNTMASVFEALLRLVSPFMPFLTEELWHTLYDNVPPAKSISLAKYPRIDREDVNQIARYAIAQMDFSTIQALIEEILALRKEQNIEVRIITPIELRIADDGRKAIERNKHIIEQQAQVGEIYFVKAITNGLSKRSTFQFDVALVNEPTLNPIDLLQNLIEEVRALRKEIGVGEREAVLIEIHSSDSLRAVVERHTDIIEHLARVSKVHFVQQFSEGIPKHHTAAFDVAIVYEKKIDASAERERLTKDIAKYEKGLTAAERQLGNEAFLKKAPAHVVEGLKKQEAEARLLLEKARAALKALPKS